MTFNETWLAKVNLGHPPLGHGEYSVFHSPCNLRVEGPTTAHAHSTGIHCTVNFKLVVHKNAILKCELTNRIRQTRRFCWMRLVNLKFNVAFLDNQPEIYGIQKLQLWLFLAHARTSRSSQIARTVKSAVRVLLLTATTTCEFERGGATKPIIGSSWNNGVKNRLDLYQVQKRPSMIMLIVFRWLLRL